MLHNSRSRQRAGRLALVAMVVAAGVAAVAQQDERAAELVADINRIFQANDFAPPRFGPARWLPDGTAYAIVERNAGGAEIARYDARTGARSVTVPASRLVPPGATKGLDIADYEWSADGKHLLIFTNTRKVWRNNTRGDYWVLDVDGGGLHKLGGDAPEATLMFAHFSPDATRVAYVRASNIYVERLADGVITPVTTNGTATLINGTSDWVYEEELGVRDCLRWSPDGRWLAYWQFDTSGVGVFTLINNTASLYPTLTKIPYPKAGTVNSSVRIGVVSAEGGETRWMQTPGDPRDTYLARMEWASPTTLSIQQLNRQQNQNDFLAADIRTGAVTRTFRDESTTWVDIEDVEPADGGRSFVIESERDGWRHLYKVPREGGNATLLTRFDADVLGLAGLDEKGGYAYFTASPGNATQSYLYRAKLDGSGTPERVTPADQPGWHAYTMAPGGKLAFHTWSRMDQPSTLDVVSLPDHKPLRALIDPSALAAKVAPIVATPTEFFQVNANGVTLDGWMIKPPSFDASKKYPVIVHVYGEPASQTVTDRWGGATMLFHRALANAGYLVVSFDGRGTPAPKGAEWRHQVYGAIGDLASKDQAAGVQALAASRPYVDADRVGVWGWSGGGSNTLNCMFRFPDVFKVGVSVAPVPDQRLYDTIYQERYMGTPQGNPDGYKLGSSINFAEGLKGRLLVIHGSGDDNVHFQGTERLINRLIELGKPFDMMMYPNRTHSISEGPGTTPHIYQRIARYFLENLPAGAR